ncbi:hypothetical protein [Azospirillum sp.]|uniref:hypothetical protein n=1 Tax=Azospirillum sp. TaxID=34012 RepID=UPI003D73CF46
MSSRRFLLLAAVASVTLAACQSAAPVRPAPRPVDFSAFGPIVLNAATIDFVDATRPAAGVHVEPRAVTPPLEALRQWTAQRLQPAGRAGSVRVTVRDASIVEVPLAKTKSGVTGYFTNEQSHRYDGRMEVEIIGEAPVSGGGSFRGTTKAAATYSATVAENATLHDRDATISEVSRRLAEEINARLDAGIRKDLTAMVVR